MMLNSWTAALACPGWTLSLGTWVQVPQAIADCSETAAHRQVGRAFVHAVSGRDFTEHILPSAGSYGQVLNCKANIPDNRFWGTDDLKPRQQKTPSLSWATQLLHGLKICGGLKENCLPWPVCMNTWSPGGCAVCGAYGDFGVAPALSPSGSVVFWRQMREHLLLASLQDAGLILLSHTADLFSTLQVPSV